jgi:hypothetical protein
VHGQQQGGRGVHGRQDVRQFVVEERQLDHELCKVVLTDVDVAHDGEASQEREADGPRLDFIKPF